MNNIRWQVVAHFTEQKPFILTSDTDMQKILAIIKSTLENEQGYPLIGVVVKRIGEEE